MNWATASHRIFRSHIMSASVDRGSPCAPRSSRSTRCRAYGRIIMHTTLSLPGAPADSRATRDPRTRSRGGAGLRLRAADALCLAGVAMLMVCIEAPAQTYPSRPIRFIVPNGMGGTTDTIARAIAQRAAEDLGQQVVVDNRPGSGGIAGTELVARAPADGYTWLMGTIGNLAISPHLYKRLGYDPLKDFDPVTQIAASAYVLLVNPAVPAKSVGELVATARSRPGKLNYASAGSGTGSHLTMELFRAIAAIDIVHVPYKGGAPGLTALVAGEVQAMFNGIPSTLPQLRNQRLRALGVTTSQRSPAIPELRTMAEAGYPGAESTSWTALLVPRGTPAPIVSRVHAAIVKAIALPDVRKHLQLDGAEPVGSTPRELRTYLEREIAKWGEVVRRSGAERE